VMLGVRFPL